jgi:hypothetical protein
MRRLINKFMDMVFYSKLFKGSRCFHYKMAYEQGKFDLKMEQRYEKLEDTYEN